MGTATYAYDSNGNMTSRGSQSISWDAENRPISISQGSSPLATFVYDGDGKRVKKTEGGETTVYVNKYYQLNLTTGEATLYYYLGDRLVAFKKGTNLSYVHQDHLAGTAVVSDSAGNQVGSINYLPYGETRTSSGFLPEQKFTGQRQDGTGLYYYGARYYDPTISRFISPDTLVQAPSNPQSLNRYSYAINNPLRYVDPTGNCWGPARAIRRFSLGARACNAADRAGAMTVDTAKAAAAAAVQSAAGDFALQGLAKATVAVARGEAKRTATITWKTAPEAPALPEVEVVQVPDDSFTGTVLKAVGAKAITLEQTVITARDLTRPEDRETGFSTGLALHETKHVMDQAEHGRGFYGDYVADLIEVGYWDNPWEVEARDFVYAYVETVVPVLQMAEPSFDEEYDWWDI